MGILPQKITAEKDSVKLRQQWKHFLGSTIIIELRWSIQHSIRATFLKLISNYFDWHIIRGLVLLCSYYSWNPHLLHTVWAGAALVAWLFTRDWLVCLSPDQTQWIMPLMYYSARQISRRGRKLSALKLIWLMYNYQPITFRRKTDVH